MIKGRKPGIISKKILRYLLIVGTVSVAASSPYFAHYLMKEIFRGRPGEGEKEKFSNTFYNLRRRGLIEVERDGHDIHISLTKEGEWITGTFELNELEISIPKKWDGKWRVIIFDIPHEYRMKRDIFRRKLKELGFYSLQKSVWIHPHECKKEINLLRDFLGLRDFEIRIIVGDIENDLYLRRAYKFK